ncbi:tRNA (adenosine(37)-N6)-threonylcarbamoyltransferase complex ATPase subunit type 1 TsaE [Mesorhizobium sp. M00.F.Ca.ET.216.01.1.1]|uniref:tRNA (adenosine(37)-N6)-threonylcarbamoyltransferase complex ATPase subunit type 1 TsaE n=1 Tax=Mesorhizobium sp. M00.F.Ca.ET.216.01.1.1 TaxID=2500528 RepID=UPI000FD8FB10|nr:tRNA (adenosine(37)-N6)-threonylcarbamoyltransferase complex ATPase subunit type 1 TsaE [Mesorhizobium sp. M00.F.Ca.ET.216.01.1.1]TGQ38627.1 tRNA (adenosine(37)-N6)-threonylcarbamoyltransferase complex ATPase subunit type 1 TsaE [Mesorhizobium sp. M00.F.Ca.ET.216.01.1.1]TJW06627.1 MAG: tRNA (adenosine(37)-N6)-threonylcarbamoyltransferase complex ATPase subunit type 1 TsaE [Mesorhizobium sp.]TJW39390.1 MAG: tRNA (adenosine(37)-N6)-threonylcarbamoyltransferase complex ATPase subunit type 1 TsaE
MAGVVFQRFLADEAATASLGEDLAMALRPGDVLALKGDLGAGKSTLARALIRALADDETLDVPSPTFTLVQSYNTRVPVHHFDLYRLSSPGEIDELGFDDALVQGAALVEWPERAEAYLPETSVLIELVHDGDSRLARLSGQGAGFERAARSLAMRDFLHRAGWGKAQRRHFVGDASARSYEIVSLAGFPPRVLMNSPRLVLGPPVRDGRPYAEIAHSAQSVSAFVAIDRALRAAGVSVPEIHAEDLDQGFLLLEHLGSEGFLGDQDQPVAERYAAAAELLAMMHGKAWPQRIEAAPGVFHDVPPFDRDAMMIEADLLVDWYVPMLTGSPASKALRAGYNREWNAVLDRLDGREYTLMLRDFHSPNIIWRGERSGHDRLGVVDFQDALIGPSAYDVASLAMDARVTISSEIESQTLNAYIAARHAAGAFDEDAFVETYAIMAAQRNSKILGIFVRLEKRDGKPYYLKHLPRIRDYLRRALAHPALKGLHDFYVAHDLMEERSP